MNHSKEAPALGIHTTETPSGQFVLIDGQHRARATAEAFDELNRGDKVEARNRAERRARRRRGTRLV
jgi:hypothetical protein